MSLRKSLLALAFSLSSYVANAAAGQVIDLGNCCNTAQEATVWSLIYGIPLIAFANQTTKVFNATGGAHRINSQTELASLTGAAVVKPNVDTIYSRVIVDLSQNDLVLTVPNITDRFWIFPFYDTFGNNFGSLSPVTNSSSGQYLIRCSDDALVQPGIQVPAPAESVTIYGKKYQVIVNYPTTYGTILIRILVKENNTENLDIVHKYQSQYNLTTTTRKVVQPFTSAVPTVTEVLNNGTTNITTPAKILSFLANISSFNQPEVLSYRARAASILGFAGLVNGRYITPPGVNLTQAYLDAIAIYTNYSALPQNLNQVSNGWQLSIPSFEGNFTTHYDVRALVAQTGYQQLTSNIVLYPGWKTSSFGSYYLGPNESFIFTFSAPPPVVGYSSLFPTKGVAPDQTGFWSLTVYGPDQYLINNTLNRFEVGDRSPNLKYEDGSTIYQEGANYTSYNKPFKVLMQRADVTPPANWTSNWLPSAVGGGNFSFISKSPLT